LTRAKLAPDNGGTKGLIDLLVQRLFASPIERNDGAESARYLPHWLNIVVIQIFPQVVIAPDHYLPHIQRNRKETAMDAGIPHFRGSYDLVRDANARDHGADLDSSIRDGLVLESRITETAGLELDGQKKERGVHL
jgi:hypothetical protein